MPDSDMTLGELARNIRSMETRQNQSLLAMEERVNHQLLAVNRRLDNMQFVNRDLYDSQMKGVIERVEDLEQSNKWLARTLATAFLVAFAAPILVAVVVTR